MICIPWFSSLLDKQLTQEFSADPSPPNVLLPRQWTSKYISTAIGKDWKFAIRILHAAFGLCQWDRFGGRTRCSCQLPTGLGCLAGRTLYVSAIVYFQAPAGLYHLFNALIMQPLVLFFFCFFHFPIRALSLYIYAQVSFAQVSFGFISTF